MENIFRGLVRSSEERKLRLQISKHPLSGLPRNFKGLLLGCGTGADCSKRRRVFFKCGWCDGIYMYALELILEIGKVAAVFGMSQDSLRREMLPCFGPWKSKTSLV